MPSTFHQLLLNTAQKTPSAIALRRKDEQLSYQQLASLVNNAAQGLSEQGLLQEQRVAIYLPKQFESVTGMFAATLAGGVFVPINPLLKPGQVSYIVNNCQVSILITSLSRYKQLLSNPGSINLPHSIILTDCKQQACPENCVRWEDFIKPQNNHQKPDSGMRTSDNMSMAASKAQDMAAILYTSGSTGQPKGVVLSHNNLVEGAKSVASYLKNTGDDKLLAVLPFSFDYGLSQLTTAFLSGASVVLLEYLLPRDVINAVTKYQITGLAAVPPLWVQLADLEWSAEAVDNLRYFTNTGGAMPGSTLAQLIQHLPNTTPFLMYGLTEAFRSTYLDPKEIHKRPASMGKAIPNAEILVINQQGEICAPEEHGELVHKGVHVAMGYWQAEEKTAEKFRPLPENLQQEYGNERVVWSGDLVKKDQDGFIYFIGRNDDMIKSSGYRISPAELEDIVYADQQVSEVAAIGVPHLQLGQAILLVIKPDNAQTFDEQQLRKYCKKSLPNFMQPHTITIVDSLPRNPNGKINRTLLSSKYSTLISAD